MTYAQYWDERRRYEAMAIAATQPLDVAVFAVQTSRLWEPYDHVPGVIQRHGYLGRIWDAGR